MSYLPMSDLRVTHRVLSPMSDLFEFLMEGNAVAECLLVRVESGSEALPQSVQSLGRVSDSFPVYVTCLHQLLCCLQQLTEGMFC